MSAPAAVPCSSLGAYGIREFAACAQRLNGGKQNVRFIYLGKYLKRVIQAPCVEL